MSEQKPKQPPAKVPDGQARFLHHASDAAERKGIRRFRNGLGTVPEGSRIQDAEEAVGGRFPQLPASIQVFSASEKIMDENISAASAANYMTNGVLLKRGRAGKAPVYYIID